MLKLINGALTVEVWGDGVPRQEAADCDLVDDVEQQEGHTGEAEGLQETPCEAWRSRRATVSSRWALCLDHTGTGREGWEPPQLLHTWRFYSAPRGIWGNFRSCYGDRSPQEDFFLMWKWKCSVSEENKGLVLPWRGCCISEEEAAPWLPRTPDPRPASQSQRRTSSQVRSGGPQQDKELMMKWMQCEVISHRRKRTLVKWCTETVWKSLHPILWKCSSQYNCFGATLPVFLFVRAFSCILEICLAWPFVHSP